MEHNPSWRGLDSLAGVEFRNRLQASFEGLQLLLPQQCISPHTCQLLLASMPGAFGFAEVLNSHV